MAALTFIAFSTFRELFDISSVFVNSGFSINKCKDYIKTKRRKYLFERFCRESWQIDTDCNSTLKLCNSTLKNCPPDGTSSVCNEIVQNKPKKLYFNQCLKIYQKLLIKNSQNKNMNKKVISKKMDTVKDTDADADDFYFVESPKKLSELMNAESFESIPIQIGQEIFEDTAYQDSIEKKPIFRNDKLAALHEGTSFMITGFIYEYCEWFSINFKYKNETNDIALHINPRLPQNYVVRNCRIKNIWGTEEVASGLAFDLHRGTRFIFEILVTEEEYYISVNGFHFAAFRHRMPYQKVQLVEVKGDVSNIKCVQRNLKVYPTRFGIQQNSKQLELFVRPSQRNLHRSLLRVRQSFLTNTDFKLPFYCIMTEKFTNGKCIQICGRIKLLPYSFYINLQKGKHIWPHPTIGFHFNPRFAKANVGRHIICRNAWIDGKWGDEERSEINTEFSPGRKFDLKIFCKEDRYEVFLNDSLICEFDFRIDPEIVDHLGVHGDIKIWSIVMYNDYLEESQPLL